MALERRSSRSERTSEQVAKAASDAKAANAAKAAKAASDAKAANVAKAAKAASDAKASRDAWDAKVTKEIQAPLSPTPKYTSGFMGNIPGGRVSAVPEKEKIMSFADMAGTGSLGGLGVDVGLMGTKPVNVPASAPIVSPVSPVNTPIGINFDLKTIRDLAGTFTPERMKQITAENKANADSKVVVAPSAFDPTKTPIGFDASVANTSMAPKDVLKAIVSTGSAPEGTLDFSNFNVDEGGTLAPMGTGPISQPQPIQQTQTQPPVDLSASIMTGINTAREKGLQYGYDPSIEADKGQGRTLRGADTGFVATKSNKESRGRTSARWLGNYLDSNNIPRIKIDENGNKWALNTGGIGLNLSAKETGWKEGVVLHQALGPVGTYSVPVTERVKVSALDRVGQGLAILGALTGVGALALIAPAMKVVTGQTLKTGDWINAVTGSLAATGALVPPVETVGVAGQAGTSLATGGTLSSMMAPVGTGTVLANSAALGKGLAGLTYAQSITALNLAASVARGDKPLEGLIGAFGIPLTEKALGFLDISGLGIQKNDLVKGLVKAEQALAGGSSVQSALLQGLGKYIKEGGSLGNLSLPETPAFIKNFEDVIKSVGSIVDDEVFQKINNGLKSVAEPVLEAGRTIDDSVLQPVKEVIKSVAEPVIDVAQEVGHVGAGVVNAVVKPIGEAGRAIDDVILQPIKDAVPRINGSGLVPDGLLDVVGGLFSDFLGGRSGGRQGGSLGLLRASQDEWAITRSNPQPYADLKYNPADLLQKTQLNPIVRR